MLVKIGNVDSRSSSGITLAVAPKMAYLNAKPWWMVFFTWSLLIKRPNVINIRVVPGMCPYRPYVAIGDYNNI